MAPEGNVAAEGLGVDKRWATGAIAAEFGLFCPETGAQRPNSSRGSFRCGERIRTRPQFPGGRVLHAGDACDVLFDAAGAHTAKMLTESCCVCRLGDADFPHSHEAHQDQGEAHQVRSSCDHDCVEDTRCSPFRATAVCEQSVPESDDADYSELPSTDDFGSDGARMHDPHQQYHHTEHSDGATNGSSAAHGQSAAAAGSNGTISTAAPVQLPCLIGKFAMDGSTPVCRGQWGMSKADHGRPDMTSPFEFRLTQAADPSHTEIPVSGKYSGWFMVKQPPPKPPLKVDEKDLEFTFTPDAEGNFEVRGTGVNRFGKFSMNGKLTPDGDLEVYRAYEVKKPAQPKSSKRVKRQELPVSPAPPARRQSRGSWKDKAGTFDDFAYDGPSEPKPKRQSTHHHAAAAAASAEVATTPAERPKRLSEHLKRCGEILRTLWKHPSAVWFREPVDPVKLGILDYFDIIKEPMDFGTIQKKLDNFEYDTPERFAEHVRLVFRNAITYNQLRTNPVHVAARELSDQFEEKYRIMISQLGSAGMTSSQPRSTNKRQRVKSRSRSSVSAAGPRSYEPVTGYDPNTPYIAEMQRQMQEMQKTIQRLQSEMKHQGGPRAAPTGAAAAEPLSMEEKRQLITQINHLPPEKLTRVVQIVQDALPARPQDDDDDEVEIPLDDLDTATLRKLQNYVEVRFPSHRR